MDENESKQESVPLDYRSPSDRDWGTDDQKRRFFASASLAFFGLPLCGFFGIAALHDPIGLLVGVVVFLVLAIAWIVLQEERKPLIAGIITGVCLFLLIGAGLCFLAVQNAWI